MFDDIYAICWGYVIHSLIDMIINTTNTKRFLGLGFTKQLMLFWPYLVLSAVVLLISLSFSHWIDNVYLSLTLSLIVCPCVYLFLSLKFKTTAALECLKIVKPYLRKLKP